MIHFLIGCATTKPESKWVINSHFVKVCGFVSCTSKNCTEFFNFDYINRTHLPETVMDDRSDEPQVVRQPGTQSSFYSIPPQ